MNNELQEILRDNGMFISSEDLNIKLDFDSVKFMEVLIDIETTFDIVIPDNE
ncbi:TPA_asm: acyl carrier protein, partial [Listeria monocytogenes]|nr:acyl carrier protein [Listeria monocytogenes]